MTARRDDRPFLGAYALVAGLPADDEAHAYAALVDLGIAGIELPVASADAGSPWFRRSVHPSWDLVVTLIPTVMQRLGTDPAYGLASTDADGRRAALDDVAAARDLARRLADDSGRPRVRAVQVNSAPRGDRASVDALARSLDELGGWDFAGATVAIEHCDAPRPGRPFHKGFLELADELTALDGRPAGRFGLTVNWGRSAIEGRSATTPVEHVRAAATAGLLAGVMFSGVTGSPSATAVWGEPWDDGHMAPRGDDPALVSSAESLLGPDEIAETLRAAGPDLGYVGVKVTVRPPDAGVAERVAVARAALAQVARAMGA
ncbi:MAG TPA: DUF4862 family protein [Cellulomonas sp.]